jgi:hypothetical protein
LLGAEQLALSWSQNRTGGNMHRTSTSLALGILFIAGLMILSLAVPCSAAAVDLEGANPSIVPILAGADPMPAPSMRVLSESDGELLLEFELPAIETRTLDHDGRTYDVLAIEGGGFEGKVGEPMLPTFSRLIQIPDRAGVSVQAEVIESRELTGYRPVPMQPDEASSFTIDAAAYSRSGYGPSDPARIGEPALARDLRVVPIMVRPVRYDPARGTIEVAGRVRIRVTFTGEDLRNTPARAPRAIAPSFDRLYRELVVNYEGARDGETAGRGCYVIICPDDGSVTAALQPLVEWRTREGYEVHLVTTAATGTTNTDIKAWIQNAYDTWDNPPEYITLVGDAGGSIAIPCWNEEHTGYNGDTDHTYVELAGDDVLPDAHIGRISVDTPEVLTLYVNKIVGYETAPYMTDTSWFTRACLVGDASGSGYTCIQIMQWLKSRLLERGYTDVDTVFAAPFVAQMLQSLNQGGTAFGYRGYLGMSGFDAGHIAMLTNGWRMPYAVNLTCGTGSFGSETSISEAWIRAGTPPSSPKGGIASVGTATWGTDTRHNNCITAGIWHAIMWEDLYQFGASLTRGKYALYANYALMDYDRMLAFIHWNNLMGDAAGEMWTGVPQTMIVTRPAQIAIGCNSVSVSVTAGGGSCAGAYVCLWKGSEAFVAGYTDADGVIELPVNGLTAGSMKITVTKHDHCPYQGTITVAQGERFVGYLARTIDDDTNGSSIGNGDGLPNPTERLELPVQLKNYGTQAAASVTGTLTTDDPYVTILDDSETFGTIPAGGTAWSADDFDIRIAEGAPHGHVIDLGLDLQSGTDQWHSLIQLPVVAAEFAFVTVGVDPGGAGLSVRIRNDGDAAATGITGTLVSNSHWVTVTDATGSFGTIGIGGSGQNAADRFVVSIASDCFQGHQAHMQLLLQFSGGARDTVDFILPVGVAQSHDPTGPDGYGYYAFDDTDTEYPYAPAYAWVEIDPNHGGSGGTPVGLTDFGDAQDDSKTVDLPFPFTYYGETFTRATICSNGWIAMGATYLTNYRNWTIPGAEAPAYMIAPMWDDLYQSGDDVVYQQFDAANHRFIVQWSRLINNNGGATENFEAILYDPAYYPTATGDGMIVFQYDAFVNCDGGQHYCTVGIENGDMSDGVMYSYFNYYNTGGAPISSGSAIKFLPFSLYPHGTLAGTVTNQTDGGAPVEGAQIRVQQTGETFVSGPDGAYGGNVRTGMCTVVATHPSFQSLTIPNVHIIEGETTILDVSLHDVAGPGFSNTTDHGNTIDTIGPYEIFTTASDISTIAELSLRYNSNGAGWVTVALESQGADQYKADIPGQPAGATIRYYLYGRDAGGNESTDPPNAPQESTYLFWVVEPALADDMESGAGGWTHGVVTDGFVDQWHLSSQRNHTPDGASSWKFGDTDSGTYASSSDGALVTEAFDLDGDATLTFWHWVDSEVSGAYQGYAYDGGLLEISVDGGPWTQIAPVGGYPYLVRTGSQPGPFPAETPVYAGTADWAQAQFDLTGVTGTAQIRFRFGSDGNTEREGWYIDDVFIVGAGPDAAAVQELELTPQRVALYQNAPNPFGSRFSETVLRFDLPKAAAVRLDIFDVGGRLVRTLVDADLQPGRHAFSWNGGDARGGRVESGVYFYILETGGRQIARRMLLVR